MQKNIWIIANWKSNKNIKEALEWIEEVGPKLEKRDNLKVVVCPPFEDLSEIKTAIQVGGYPLILGCQDLSPFPEGSFTGEEPAAILDDLVELAILGHSERRENFHETDELVAQKVKQSLEHKITPLVCVQGEETPVPEGCKLVAFEPIAAIGTGHPDNPLDTDKVARSLRGKHGEGLEILYGGSVNSANVKDYLELTLVSGVLVGKASLEAVEFVKIVEQAYLI